MVELAFLVLFTWPFVVLYLFNTLPVERALIWSLLAGYMVLPEVIEVDLPLIPALDKATIPSLTAIVCLIMLGRKVPFLLPNPIVRILLLLLILSPIGTVLTNREPVLFAAGGYLPALQPREAISMVINQVLYMLPLFMGYAVLRTEAAVKELVRAFFVAALIYSIPMLLEIRLSPQLNLWVYGYYQFTFLDAIRFGGYRPVVFMPHGLYVAIFTLFATLCAISLARHADAKDRPMYTAYAVYLTVVLVLCKSLGAWVYFAMFAPLVFFATRKTVITVAAAIAATVMLYPILRGAGFVPVDLLLEQFARISEDRAQSLGFRLDQEAQLLDRASEKPFFGWGGWHRNHIHDAFSGRLLSIADGHWVIVIGISGWIGYIAEFGLLTVPLVLLFFKTRGLENAAISPWLSTLALLHAINLLDLLPNATIIPLTWLVCGAILGRVESLGREERPVESLGVTPYPVARRTLI